MCLDVSKWSQLGMVFAATLLVQASVILSAIAQDSKGDLLLITSERDAYKQIIRVLGDGSGRKVLTGEREFAADPSLSPDGKRIAFVAVVGDLFVIHPKMGLFVMNVDGSGRTRLAEKELGDRIPAAPNWSPDGKRIAFCTRPQGGTKGKYQLHVVDADGRNIKPLDTVEAIAPVWSPDGKRLLITRLREPKTGRWKPSLCTVNVDGTNLRELVPGGFSGAWSPDGKALAFTAMFLRHDDQTEAEPGGLFVAHADGSKPKRIAELGKLGFSKTAPAMLHLFGLQWSRDSKQLFFSRIGQRDNDLEKTIRPWTIQVIDANGRNLRQVNAADVPEYLGITTLER